MGFSLTATDQRRLDGIDSRLAAVIRQAAALSPYPFKVLEGRRTLARQRELFDKGHTKTLHSLHLDGRAVDVAPLHRGKVSWSWPLYYNLSTVIKDAAKLEGVSVQWGGDWRTFKDGPHWQLAKTEKPT